MTKPPGVLKTHSTSAMTLLLPCFPLLFHGLRAQPLTAPPALGQTLHPPHSLKRVFATLQPGPQAPPGLHLPAHHPLEHLSPAQRYSTTFHLRGCGAAEIVLYSSLSPHLAEKMTEAILFLIHTPGTWDLLEALSAWTEYWFG